MTAIYTVLPSRQHTVLTSNPLHYATAHKIVRTVHQLAGINADVSSVSIQHCTHSCCLWDGLPQCTDQDAFTLLYLDLVDDKYTIICIMPANKLLLKYMHCRSHFARLFSHFHHRVSLHLHACLTGLALTQVWRPLRGPVDDSPLGMIDAASVAKEDLLPYAIHFPGRTGYNYAVSYNPEHRQVSPCMELQPPGQLYANWFFRVRIFEIVNHAAEKCCRCCETHTILLQQ